MASTSTNNTIDNDDQCQRISFKLAKIVLKQICNIRNHISDAEEDLAELEELIVEVYDNLDHPLEEEFLDEKNKETKDECGALEAKR